MSIFDRLTDTSKYTGTHKQRFDADGKGRGIEGRSDRIKNDGYVTGYKDTSKSSVLSKKDASVVNRLTDASKYTGSHKQRFDADGKGKGIEGREDRASAEGYTNGYKASLKAPSTASSTSSPKSGPSIFDKLTDTSKYTGTHKNRFDASGKGKGIEGRREVAKNDGYHSTFKT